MGQHDGYADPKFGVEQAVVLPTSGSLAGTVAATEITRMKTKRAVVVSDIGLFFTAGGTAATRKYLLGLSLAGTGATSQLGTYTLGTQATKATLLTGLGGTFAANDDIVISHLGTDAIVYDIRPTIFYAEKFVQA
jgi:hypothetical protein